MEEQHFCDERRCMEMATEPAPGWPAFRLCKRHADAIRGGRIPELVREDDRSGPQRWQMNLGG